MICFHGNRQLFSVWILSYLGQHLTFMGLECLLLCHTQKSPPGQETQKTSQKRSNEPMSVGAPACVPDVPLFLRHHLSCLLPLSHTTCQSHQPSFFSLKNQIHSCAGAFALTLPSAWNSNTFVLLPLLYH